MEKTNNSVDSAAKILESPFFRLDGKCSNKHRLDVDTMQITGRTVVDLVLLVHHGIVHGPLARVRFRRQETGQGSSAQCNEPHQLCIKRGRDSHVVGETEVDRETVHVRTPRKEGGNEEGALKMMAWRESH